MPNFVDESRPSDIRSATSLVVAGQVVEIGTRSQVKIGANGPIDRATVTSEVKVAGNAGGSVCEQYERWS
jgi:hypothetical protein